MEQPTQMPPEAMAPAMAPTAPAGPEAMVGAEATAGIGESLNIAVQATIEAAEAAKMSGEAVSPQTVQKIEAAALTLAEAQEELTAPPVAEGGAPAMAPAAGPAAPEAAGRALG